MYGMVNRAVEEMVTQSYGDETWEAIKAEAGVNVDVFIGNEGYPDDVTYALVAAAARVLSLPPEDVLVAFGEYWVLHTARDGYSDLMAAGGRSLPEFLHNLPGFHARVSLIYPNLAPPLFRVTDETASSLHLHYYSHRPGLKPFVIGLLHGLGKMFDTAVKVNVLNDRESGGDHEEFFVLWSSH